MPSAKAAPRAAAKTGKKLAPRPKNNTKKEAIAEGGTARATRATRSRGPAQEKEVSSPRGRAPKTVTSKARRGGAKGGAGATKAGANDKLVPIYCGQGSWKQLGTYNVDTGLVDPKAARLGSGLVPETFCLVAGVKTTATTWKKALLVQGDGEGRNLADWLNQSCEGCKSPGHEECMLICDNDACQKHWHIYCLRPKLPELPAEDEDWYCPDCAE